MNLQEINFQIIAPILIIQLILMVIGLVDLSKRESTRGPKLMWVFIIIFCSLLGSISYFVIGRRNDS